MYTYYKIQSKYKQKCITFVNKKIKEINDRIVSYDLPFSFCFFISNDFDYNMFDYENRQSLPVSFINYDELSSSQEQIPIIMDFLYIYQSNKIQGIKWRQVCKQVQYSLWMNVAQFLIYKLNKQMSDILPQFNKNYVIEQFVNKKGRLNQSFLAKLFKCFYS